MTPSDRTRAEGPEPVPPAELLRLRNVLTRAPRAEVRARHLAATVGAAQQRTVVSPVGRFAGHSARTAAVIVAALAITSGLAGAQLLPAQAQRLLSSVSERLNPIDDGPSIDSELPAPEPTQSGSGGSSKSRTGSDDDPTAPAEVSPSTTDDITGASSTTAASSSTTSPPRTTTTIAGPTGPGSPDDPGSTTTSTTDPGSTTTTTDPSTTSTTDPSTTSTTGPSSTTTAPPPP